MQAAQIQVNSPSWRQTSPPVGSLCMLQKIHPSSQGQALSVDVRPCSLRQRARPPWAALPAEQCRLCGADRTGWSRQTASGGSSFGFTLSWTADWAAWPCPSAAARLFPPTCLHQRLMESRCSAKNATRRAFSTVTLLYFPRFCSLEAWGSY